MPTKLKWTPEERFWNKVAFGDRCWEWEGATMPEMGHYLPYGRARLGKKVWLAHRLAWTLKRGPVPSGLLVLHRCDNPRCVRPGHLYLGTTADNTRDAIERGRFEAGRALAAARRLNAARTRARAQQP